MTVDPKQESRSSPATAKLITIVLLALAVYSEVRFQHVDPELVGALVILVAFWMGQGIDRLFPFR